MPVELFLILCLILIFLVPIFFDVNVGIVAFIVSFLVGTLVLGMSALEVVSGFPDNMFLMLVGITLLLGIANQNGTVDWMVSRLVKLARGHLALLPWALFGVAFITSTLGPGAAPILFVVGIGFVARYGMSPLLIAAMIVHGNQSGGYSPVAPYGLLIGGLLESSGLEFSPFALYFGVVLFHFALAGVVFLLLGGRKLIGVRVPQSEFETEGATSSSISGEQSLTLVGFLALVLGVLLFDINVGFLAISISFVLLLAGEKAKRQAAINHVAWPVVLVIAGVLTYVNLLQEAGATHWLALQADALGSPLLVGLLLCFIVGLVTGVASTMGTIGILVPLSTPFLVAGDLETTTLMTAMSISAAVTDISPFSPLGAMFVGIAAQALDRDQVFRAQLKYTLYMMSVVPIVAWLIFVVPRW